MTESKYGKYIVRGTNERIPSDPPGVRSRTLDPQADWAGIQPRLDWKYVSRPVQIYDEPHSHDFDEFLIFTGCDPANPDKFEAEVEVSMGEEGEKSIINTPTIVCLPKGLVHGPVNFTKVSEPVVFCNVYLSPDYEENK